MAGAPLELPTRAEYAGEFPLAAAADCRAPTCTWSTPAVSIKNDESPDFSKGDGLLPAIAQDAATGEVLMLAYMNADSYAETLSTGRAVYFSRSRNKLWRKGEESGHVQHVQGVYLDCDTDTILLKVEQVGGAACHEGYSSCFFRQVTPEGLKVVGNRVFDPRDVYKKK
jgi:phosphoribosyl-AMP cyclohydrolase